jgi:D-serine deaminase-like pyridoxal phosphate-dependent protein
MHVTELETPSVLINLDVMERNIQTMQARCDAAGVKFRPHIKTHKIPAIAKMQLEAGAVGIACQKVSEAQVFAEAGINDILLPYNIVGAKKAARLADLALYNKIAVSADSPETIHGLGAAAKAVGASIRVLIELATEIERAGTSVENVVQLAQQIEADDHLEFRGLVVYPSFPKSRPLIQEALARLDAVGIGVEVVSGGGVGAAHYMAEVPELTEIRVGTYVYNDWRTVMNGYAALDDCAMTIAATVVSRPTDDRAIIDSGSKTLSSEQLDGAYGFILEYPLAKLYNLNEEHGYVDFSKCDDRPHIGEVVHVIPIHTCVVSNLHNQVYGVRNDEVEVEWPVAARGLVW